MDRYLFEKNIKEKLKNELISFIRKMFNLM